MEVEFRNNTKRYRISRELVEKALAGVEPDVVWDLAVYVHDSWYPVKQALVAPYDDLTTRDTNSRFAWRILRKLGLPLHDKKVDGSLPAAPTGTEAADRETHRLALGLAAEVYGGTGATAATVLDVAGEFEDWLINGVRPR